MAGERLGKIYEAILFVSTKNALSSNYPLIPVIWNPPKNNLMVPPDICIGDPLSPQAIFLITRSGSRRNWEMKFWRTVGEIVDIRSSLPETKIINFSLGTEIKEELLEVLDLLVDINIFPNREIREQVEDWAKQVERGSPRDKDSLIEYVENKLKTAPTVVKNLISSINDSIKNSLTSKNSSWSLVNDWLKNRRKLITQTEDLSETPTAIRRGLAKLLIFGEPQEVFNSINSKLVVTDQLGKSLASFGWATKSLLGWRINDPEILNVVKLLDRDTILKILLRSTSEELHAMCADVASEDWIISVGKYLIANKNELSDVKQLTSLFIESLIDPNLNGQIDVLPPKGITGNWLFRILLTLIKLASGLKQGYGYEQLVGDIREIYKEKDSLTLVLEAGATDEQVLRAGTTDSLRRKLVDWASGLKKVSLAEWQILLISVVIAKRLESISSKEFEIACKELPNFLRRLTYEDRVAPYRFFEPLRSIIEIELEKANIEYQFNPRLETLVSEASFSMRNPGTTPVIQTKGTIIHWKSAHGSHTSDKTKELCGRAFCIRHRLNRTTKIPLQVSSIKKLILLIDGDFNLKEIEHLIIAGWDEVLRPHQIDKIIKAIE
jgi:hypothetical protein